ncbi:hypothetical protein Bca101_019213 [Brassica carinata]
MHGELPRNNTPYDLSSNNFVGPLSSKTGLDVFEANARKDKLLITEGFSELGIETSGCPQCHGHERILQRIFAAALASDPVWIMNVIPARKQIQV